MKIFVCPDKFAGTLTARQAALAIAGGWQRGAPHARSLVRPFADGGPGFLDTIASKLRGQRVATRTCDPLRRPVDAEILLAGSTAYLESAQTCGLHLVAPCERDPLRASSYGLGVLIAAAIDRGARQVVVGLGGSATVDCGAGMLAALGAVLHDADGTALTPCGGALNACTKLSVVPVLDDVELVAAADIAIPLLGHTGAARAFGPQKGAGAEEVDALELGLATFATRLTEACPRCPADLTTRPGSGASGGISAAILALGGRCLSGAELVWSTLALEDDLAACDLALTGEGCVDAGTLHGKAPKFVSDASARLGIPCLVLAGQVGSGSPTAQMLGVAAVYSVAAHLGSVAAALDRPAEGLAGLAEHVARNSTHCR